MSKAKKLTNKKRIKEQNISMIKQEREKQSLKVELCKACDERLRTKDVLVAVNQHYGNIKFRDLFGQSTIFVGPAQVGKSSCIYHILPDTVSVININCKIYKSQNQFIERFIELLKDVLDLTDVHIDKKLVANEILNLNPLNDILAEAKKQIIIVIQYAQNLTNFKKQDLLYNFIDWVKDQIVKNFVGIVFVTRCVQFTDKFQKRVKSRHNSQVYYHPYPTQKEVINMIVGRIRYADCQTTTSKKLQDAIKQNNSLKANIKNLIEKTYPKKLTYYLNAFQIVFSSLNEHILQKAQRKQLHEHISNLFTQALKFLPGQNLTPRQLLLINCDYPDYLIFAAIHYMTSNDKYPITFNTVFQTITDFTNRHRSSTTTVGHSMNFQPKVYERAIKKLSKLKLISLPQIHQSFANKQIISYLNVEEIQDALQSVPNPHSILKAMLKG